MSKYYRCNVCLCGVNTKIATSVLNQNCPYILVLSSFLHHFCLGEDLSDAVHDSPVDRSFSPLWESESAHHRRKLAIWWSSGGTAHSEAVKSMRSPGRRWCSSGSSDNDLLFLLEDGAEARSASQVSDRGAEACTAAVRVAVGDRAFRGDGGSPRCASCQSGPLLTGGFRVLCA